MAQLGAQRFHAFQYKLAFSAALDMTLELGRAHRIQFAVEVSVHRYA
jgi:hypothetical protein